MRYSRTYTSWKKMKARVAKPHREVYSQIDMDPRWASYDAFYADMGDRPEGMTLDRADNMKGYWPSNCRWATARQQANNVGRNNNMTYQGETHSISEWARITGVFKETLRYRFYQGWTPEEVLHGKAS
jgi:hypothetical protein